MTTTPVPIVDIYGTPKDRGRAHGEALRAQIATVRGQWRESIVARFRVDPDSFIETFLAETRFIDAMRRWTPALINEIEGIAEGSARPLNETIAFQCMDEEWWFGATRFGPKAGATTGCSVIASAGRDGQPPILAQNMDLHGYLDGGQAVIRISGGDEPDATILTICGMIALCGANALGLGVAVNTLWQLPSASDGLPVACVVRALLAKRSLSDATRWIESAHHASGQHYIIGDPSGFASFEASGTSVTPVPLTPSAYVHTNHPLVGGSPPYPAEENSRGRYLTLCHLLADKALTVAEVEAALADRSGPHPISVRKNPNNRGRAMTFASIVMELGRPPKIRIAGGPPCSNAYRSL
ncbi:MAG: C45 family peptidase [Candidatus Binataceae bacterium]